MKVLLRFPHGFGDAVQLTVVLRHLRRYRPEWELSLEAKRGKHSVGHGLCRRVWHDQEPGPNRAEFDQIYSLGWFENYNGYSDRPCSKVTNCLAEVFRLPWDAALGQYHLLIPQEARDRACAWLESIGCRKREDGRYNAMLLHYEGNTSGWKKNLSHGDAWLVCDVAREHDCVPVVLDWDRRSPLPDGKTIHCPGVGPGDLWGNFGSGDAACLAALIDSAAVMVGIDSGPGHVAGATSTPTLIVWLKHHPIQFYDPCPNVLHLVPADHADCAPNRGALAFFSEHYRHHVHDNLPVALAQCLVTALTGNPPETFTQRRFLSMLRSTAFNKNYYEEHRLAGLDYLNFGDWQREYGRWFVDSLDLHNRSVLDVGCACGAILRGLGEAGALVQGVDVSEHMVQLARQKWPDMTPVIHTCDALNLHLYADGMWDCLHCAQVAEHWKPHHVQPILQELARVTKVGGLFFCCLDTEELVRRQGRDLHTEDPTHYTLRPMSWWHEQAVQAGWQVCTQEFETALREHPLSFLKRYDWDWFMARKMATEETACKVN